LIKTASTEYDENLENQPKEEVSSRSKRVKVLSLLGNESDKDDIGEIYGYKVVNIIEVIETN
jgi:hypothetical protein